MNLESRAYLALSLTKGVGPRTVKAFVEHITDARFLHDIRLKDLLVIPGISRASASAFIAMRDSDEPEKECRKAESLGVNILTLNQEGYPALLRHIYSPPTVLYVQGILPAALKGSIGATRSVAVVGTRRASDYGLAMSFKLAHDLAEAGICVISGLAFGVDAQAHRGALKAQSGGTVAVLGSSLDHIYPARHQTLAQQISEIGGAIVSEYRFGTRPRGALFPARNRIIAGLADAVLVIEAGERSGALITADMALEEGRSVFALPGRVDDARAKGSHGLLRQGALLVESVEDILEEFSWRSSAVPAPSVQLTGLQQRICHHLKSLGSPLFDDLLGVCELDTAVLQTQLSLLELQQVIVPVPGGRYRCL